jgi:thiol-disulfide isomerase/thioredoxin
MKKLIILIASCFCLSACIQAESTKNTPAVAYTVVGYAGKDTLHLGTTTLKDGKLSIDLGNYRGAIELQYQDARYEEILKHLRETGNIRSLMVLEAAKNYVADELPFEDLYRSGFWQEYIQQWVGFYINTSPSPEAFAEIFVPVAKRVFDRTITNNPQTATYLATDLINFFEQFGLDKAAEEIAVYVYELGIANNKQISRMVSTANLIGKKAPALAGLPEQTLQGKTSILLFYSSDCGHCEEQLKALIEKYPELNAKGIQVISISADYAEEIYKTFSDLIPWKNKLCDFNGKEGVNFINYGVVNTPTFYLINKEGIVQVRYATLESVLKDI